MTDLESAKAVGGCVCFTLRKGARAVAKLYDDALKPSGLRNTQFSLLGALDIMGEATVGHLASEMAMDRTTLTRNLRVLVRDGYVEDGVAEDGRKRVVRLTKSGRVKLAEALPLWQDVQQRVLAGLGLGRWQRLAGDLGAVQTISAETASHE
ncbi:MAG: MarR family winged helix-turn-helix transcriptional regulator [Alphaproteobacteria bacterium]